MPDELVSAADAFMANVWSLSLQQADRVLASQRQELEAEREAVHVRLQAAHDRIQQLEAASSDTLQNIASLEEAVQSRDGTIAELRIQIQETQRQRDALESRVKLLEDAAEGREQKFVAESERLTRLLQNDRDRYTAALKEEQERSASERETLLKQIEQARQDKVAEMLALRQQVSNREEREARQREQTEDARAALREAVSKARQIETSWLLPRAHRTPAGPAQDCQRRSPRQGVGGGRRRGPRPGHRRASPRRNGKGPAGRGPGGRDAGRAGSPPQAERLTATRRPLAARWLGGPNSRLEPQPETPSAADLSGRLGAMRAITSPTIQRLAALLAAALLSGCGQVWNDPYPRQSGAATSCTPPSASAPSTSTRCSPTARTRRPSCTRSTSRRCSTTT
jgi:hypothetical protein